MNQLGRDLLSFSGQGKTKVSLIEGKLEIPPESPCFSLGLNRAFLTVHLSELGSIIHPPKTIGRKS